MNLAISLNDDTYAAFKAAIRESVFAPGVQLSENELALRFGTSRTPIHEAALRLQEEGLLKILPKKGIVISALIPDDLREIYEVIIAIESAAAFLAANLSDDTRYDLCNALSILTDEMQTQDKQQWAQSDEAFHRLLVEKCGNSRFVKIMQTVNDQSHRARTLTLKLRVDLSQSVNEHRAIIGHIRANHGVAAYEAAEIHRKRARDEVLPLIAKLGLNHL